MSTIYDLASEIALQLGESWKADEDVATFYARIIGPSGVKLSIRRDKTKVRVTGIYPGGLPYNYRHDGAYGTERPPYIGVSESRGAAIIAKEIRRRFLPRCLSLLAQCQEKQAADVAYEKKKTETKETLVAAFGGKTVFDHSIHFRAASCHGVIEVNSSIDVRLEDMSLDTALRLAEFLGVTE